MKCTFSFTLSNTAFMEYKLRNKGIKDNSHEENKNITKDMCSVSYGGS